MSMGFNSSDQFHRMRSLELRDAFFQEFDVHNGDWREAPEDRATPADIVAANQEKQQKPFKDFDDIVEEWLTPTVANLEY